MAQNLGTTGRCMLMQYDHNLACVKILHLYVILCVMWDYTFLANWKSASQDMSLCNTNSATFIVTFLWSIDQQWKQHLFAAQVTGLAHLALHIAPGLPHITWTACSKGCSVRNLQPQVAAMTKLRPLYLKYDRKLRVSVTWQHFW